MTPDETKKGLECCSNVNFVCNEECPYYKSLSEGEDCCLKKNADALAYIQQLEAANAELLTKVEQLETKCHQLERERDAAVADIGRSRCDACKHKILDDSMQELSCMANNYNCNSCDEECRCKACNDGSFFEWRGVKEE